MTRQEIHDMMKDLPSQRHWHGCCNGDCNQGRWCPRREETLGEKIQVGLVFIIFMFIMVFI